MKRKNKQSFYALLLVLAMVFSLTGTAFAAALPVTGEATVSSDTSLTVTEEEAPSDDVPAAEEVTVLPEEDAVTAAEEPAAPEEDLTAAADETAAPEDDPVTVEEETAAPDVDPLSTTAESAADTAGEVFHPNETLAESGYIATDINLGERDDGLVAYAALPSSWDSRTNGSIPEQVRNQGSDGICWSYAVIEQAESYLLTHNLGGFSASAIDFSEMQLAWNMYHTAVDPLGLTSGDSITYEGNMDYLALGGNDYYAMRVLSQWKGSATESQINGTAESASQSFTSTVHLKNASLYSPTDSDAIKTAIMEHGSVTASYFSNDTYLNKQSYAYYCPNASKTNHSVALVGWDDSFSASRFSTRPAGNGAWLVRNSWGNEWGNGGYFWLSYYDASFLGSSECMAAEYTLSDGQENLYYYDGTTASANLYRTTSGAALYGQGAIFTAQSDETITSVTIQTLGSALSEDPVDSDTQWGGSFDYTLSIWLSPKSNNPAASSDPNVTTATSSTKGTVSGAGCYTLTLDKPVKVSKGQTFSVDFRTSQPVSFYVDNSSTSDKTATRCTYVDQQETGQTFFRYEKIDDAVSASKTFVWSDAAKSNCTMRIHAVTKSAKTAAAPAVPTLKDIQCGAGDTVKLSAASTVSDGGKLSWQWYQDEKAIKGATSKTYTVDTSTPGEHQYYARVTNSRSGYRSTSQNTNTITVSVELKAPQTISATNKAGGISLSWDACVGAEGYCVYRQEEDASLSDAEMLQTATNSYLDVDVEPGKTYTYRVQTLAESKELFSDISTSSASLIYLPYTTLTGISGVSGSITLEWAEAEGAESYRVYRKVAGQSWTKSIVLDEVQGLSYTDNTATDGTTYTYTVRAMKGTSLGAYDATGLSLLQLSIPKAPTLTNTASGIKISWSTVKGALKYRVFRKTDKTGWERIAITAKKSYTDKTAKAGTTYYYTLRAVNGSVVSGYDKTGSTAVRLTTPKISSLKSGSKKKLTLKWKKEAKAAGYEIQYATKSTFSNAKTVKIKKKTTVSKTISKLTSKKTYYVRIRSFAVATDGSTSYSGWSSTKKVLVK